MCQPSSHWARSSARARPTRLASGIARSAKAALAREAGWLAGADLEALKGSLLEPNRNICDSYLLLSPSNVAPLLSSPLLSSRLLTLRSNLEPWKLLDSSCVYIIFIATTAAPSTPRTRTATETRQRILVSSSIRSPVCLSSPLSPLAASLQVSVS